MIGMCQKCYTSGIEVMLAEITKNDVGTTEVVMCKNCRE